MKLLVHEHTIEIEKSPVNEKEINISKCEFIFDEAITDEFVKKALFTLDKGNTYEVTIVNNECDIPQEALQHKGTITIGVVATLIENEQYIKRYNPSPAHIGTWEGSLKQATNSEPITPTDKEQIEQALQDMETKVDTTTTITITKKDGTQETTEVNDGIGLNYNWSGTSLGIKRENEQSYDYVNLKGDKGDAGAIKIRIVNQLPETGADDTFYLVPKQSPKTQDLYDEYVWTNNAWELVGEKQIIVDLSDYYTKTETNSLLDTKNPLIDSSHKLSSDLVDDTNATNKFFSGNYNDLTNKPTIPTVPTNVSAFTNDANYTTKTYVDGLVGDIATTLDTIQGEVI